MASKNWATSRDSGAEPEMKNRSRPPKSWRTLRKTSRSASRCRASSSGPSGSPSRRFWAAASPTSMAHRKSAARTPPWWVAPCTTLAWTFSKMRGTAQTKVGLKRPRFSTSFSTRPSTAVGKPTRSWAVPIILPKLWASGSQKSCETCS